MVGMKYNIEGLNKSSVFMCLTIPKKITAIKNGVCVLERENGEKQEAKSIIPVKKGNWVLTQNNIIIQKLTQKQAQEINQIFNS